MCLCLEAKWNVTSDAHIHQFDFPQNRVPVFKLPPGTGWSPRSLFTPVVPGVKRRGICRLGNVGNGGHVGSLARWEQGGSLQGERVTEAQRK